VGCGFSIGMAFLAWVFGCIYTTGPLLCYLLGYVLRRYTKGFGEEFLLSHNITIESRIYVQLLLIYLSLAFAWLWCCVRGISSPCTIGVSDFSVDCFFGFPSFVDFFRSRRMCFPRSLYIHLPVTRDRCWKWFWREWGGGGSRFTHFFFLSRFCFTGLDCCSARLSCMSIRYYLPPLVYFEDLVVI